MLDFNAILSLFQRLAWPRISYGNPVSNPIRQHLCLCLTWLSAVKFIRDQAGSITSAFVPQGDDKPKGPTRGAQAAALALRRILIGDGGPDTDVHISEKSQGPDVVDPFSGWSDGVSLRKSHFCLLLKPQIVLRSDTSLDSVCVLAAVQAKLQSFGITDDSNVEDPVSGQIMTRSESILPLQCIR